MSSFTDLPLTRFWRIALEAHGALVDDLQGPDLSQGFSIKITHIHLAVRFSSKKIRQNFKDILSARRMYSNCRHLPVNFFGNINAKPSATIV
jgi:hypothetical protein